MKVGGTWIEQPRGSALCGQIAVAVIADVPLEEIIEMIGRKPTKSLVLSLALRHYGYEAPARARALKEVPPLAIGQLRYIGGSGYRWHWVAIIDGIVFDGAQGGPLTSEQHQIAVGPYHRITSYLPVT